MGDELPQRLPDGFHDMAPGPGLALVLATIDRTRLCGSDAVSVLQARARQVAYEHGQLLADLEEVSRTDWHSGPGTVARTAGADEFAVDQVGWALHWSREVAAAWLRMAVDLLHRLPAVHAALVAGRIDLPRARVFHEALLDCDDEVARRLVDLLVDQAAGWTCGRLRQRLRYHRHKHDPDHAARRYRRAVTGRQVRAWTSPDGTANLIGADLPIDRAAAADDYLTRLARAAKAAGDPRTVTQLRADAYLDLLAGIAFRTHPSRDPITTDADHDAAAVERAVASQKAARVHTGGNRVGEHPASADLDDELDEPRSVPARAVADPDQPPVGAADVHPDPTGVTQPPEPESGPGPGPDARVGALDGRVCCTCGGLRPADRRGVVTVTMTLPTLLGLTDDPALIPGWGPVLADIARQIALDHTQPPSWQFGLTDRRGNLLHAGAIRRRPSAAAVRITRLRDRTCRAVNCARPATACDTDHRRAHASGGHADPTNLDTLCRHHHRLKHAKNLTLNHLGHGSYQWQAPNGRKWTVPADNTALLTADETTNHDHP